MNKMPLQQKPGLMGVSNAKEDRGTLHLEIDVEPLASN